MAVTYDIMRLFVFSTLESFDEISSGSQDFLFFCLTPFHIKYCYTTTGGEPGGGGGAGRARGGTHPKMA